MFQMLVLDIETIADPDACARAGVDPQAGFPSWPLHQLLCVSLLAVTRGIGGALEFGIATFSRSTLSERAIVAEVERRVEQTRTLLTYNGRGFDIPVLLARAAVTGEAVPGLIRAGSRASCGFHTDLMDEVTANGAAVRPKLLELCAGFCIPAKLDIAGSSVAALAAAGEYARIERYCETDVVATWLAAQMWWSMLHTPGTGVERWRALAGWIRTGQPRLAHLLPYTTLPNQPGGGRALGNGSDAVAF